jgi:hypothetical protein
MTHCDLRHRLPALAATLMCAASTLSACATNLDRRPCSDPSLECIAETQRRSEFRACIEDLFWNKQSDRSTRKAISAAYRYPYTDAETYFRLVRGGAVLISPNEWCKAYARRTTPSFPRVH